MQMMVETWSSNIIKCWRQWQMAIYWPWTFYVNIWAWLKLKIFIEHKQTKLLTCHLAKMWNKGMLFQMASRKIAIAPENLGIFHFSEFQEKFDFWSSDLLALKFIVKLPNLCIQFTESRYAKSFCSYKHLFASRHFPEWPQRVQQTWKNNDLNITLFSPLLKRLEESRVVLENSAQAFQ